MRKFKKIQKKAITLLAVSTLALSFTACGNNKTADITEQTTEVKEPTDLTGTWRSEDNDGSYQEAIITDGTIEINWITDNGKTKSLYWAGTYTAPTEYVEKYSWVSENDTAKTDSALLASSDETKEFNYENNIISYEISAMGTTTTLELTKQN